MNEKTKEQVYDEQIHPLMEKIIAIVHEHKIATICDFHLGDDLHCTTAALEDEYDPSEEQLDAYKLFRPSSYQAVVINVTDAGGKIVRSEAILG